MKFTLFYILTGFASTSFAQSFLMERCRQVVQEYEAANSTDSAISRFQRLVNENKAAAARVAVHEQQEFERIILELYRSAPSLQQYVHEKNQLTVEQRNSSLGTILLGLIDKAMIRDHFRSTAGRLVSEGMRYHTASGDGLDLSLAKNVDVGGLAMGFSSSSYVRLIENTLHLVISISVHAQEAPMYLSMAGGLRIVNLETGADVERIEIPNWGGPKERLILTEPFSAWERFIENLGLQREPQQVRDCRQILNRPSIR